MGRIALLLFFVSLTYGHIRFGWPTARNQNTGIKGPYPCGPDPFWGNGQAHTVLNPGKVVITLQETINHIGAPFRIALSPNDDTHYDKYILLDDVPHNDKWGNYGMDNPKPYTLELNIPDIDCPKCSLQVLEIMTDKIPHNQCCTYPNRTTDMVCPSVYHSCANVQILGKIPIPQFTYTYTGPCGPYTQMSGTWLQNATTLAWYLANPNYVANLTNNCAGWKRNCAVQPRPVKPPPITLPSLVDIPVVKPTDSLNSDIQADSGEPQVPRWGIGLIVVSSFAVAVIIVLVIYNFVTRNSYEAIPDGEVSLQL
jgi:hypothetical protein